MAAKAEDLTGRRFGKLTVIQRASDTKNRGPLWACRCECGGETTARSHHLKQGGKKSCGCLHRRKGPAHPNWGGTGEISGDFWNSIERRGTGDKRGKADFDIDPDFIWDLFLEQERRCALSGLELTMLGRGRTASLDRIDNGLGYTKGNVQWVHKHINKMKNVFDQQYFVDMCKSVAERQ